MKRIIFGILILVLGALILWQGIFWGREYVFYKEYKSVMAKAGNFDVTFCGWAKSHSLLKMPAVGYILQQQSYNKYVAVQKSAGKSYVLWNEWKMSAGDIERLAREAMEMVRKQTESNLADEYGGATPEETWEMFLDALQSGDLELASKYFVPEKQAQNLEWFKKVRDNGLLDAMVGDLTVSEITRDSATETLIWCHVSSVDDNGKEAKISIQFRKNINNKWKLESI